MAQRKVHPARKAFDKVERTAAGPLEQAINSPSGGSALMTVAKVTRFGLGQVGAIRSRIVHLAALPTSRDVQLLSSEIGRLQERVEELTQRLEEDRTTKGPSAAGTAGAGTPPDRSDMS